MLDVSKIRVRAFTECEEARECKKDYWTYEAYIHILECIVIDLRFRVKDVKEGIRDA